MVFNILRIFHFGGQTQPSWRHLPDLSDRHMIAYKESDVKSSWAESGQPSKAPKVCGYVKVGKGNEK